MTIAALISQSAQLARRNASEWWKISASFIAFIFLCLMAEQWLKNWYLADGTPRGASNYALLRMVIWFFEAIAISLALQSWVQKLLVARKPSRRISINILAVILLAGFGVLGFVIVVGAPLLHLASILVLKTLGFWLLMIIVALPLFLWFAHYLARLLLAIPIWVNGQSATLRDALHFTQDHPKLITKAAFLWLALVAIVRLITGFLSGWWFAIIAALLVAGLIEIAGLFLVILYRQIRAS